jgi:hypothetical protein
MNNYFMTRRSMPTGILIFLKLDCNEAYKKRPLESIVRLESEPGLSEQSRDVVFMSKANMS